VLIEEEQSGDVEIGHTTERVGYFALEAGAITDSAGSVIGEAGGIVREQVDRSQWHTVNLAGIYQNPVLMINIVTYAGQQPAHLRLRNVGMSSFQFQLEEWLYLDGYHVDEQLHYVVLESPESVTSRSIGMAQLAETNSVLQQNRHSYSSPDW